MSPSERRITLIHDILELAAARASGANVVVDMADAAEELARLDQELNHELAVAARKVIDGDPQ